MSQIEDTIMPSLPDLDPCLDPKQYEDIDELRDVEIVELVPEENAPLVETPYGSVRFGPCIISTTLDAISERKPALKRAWNSSQSPTGSPKMKAPSMTMLLTDLCCEKSITCNTEWTEMIHRDHEVKMFNRRYGGMMNFQRCLTAATDTAYHELPPLTFEERLEQVNIEESATFFEALHNWKVFINETLTPDKFYLFVRVMNLNCGKIKSIYMVGQAGGGKSAIILLLTSVYRFSEIGKASAQSLNSSFWLQDMIDKRVGVLDEVLATQVNIDALKMLMEGNFFADTDVKFGKRSQIKPMPILIACNMEITRLVQGHAAAVHARCIKHEFNKATKLRLHYKREILAMVLKRLVEDMPIDIAPAAPPIECLIKRVGDGDPTVKSILGCGCPTCSDI